MSDRASETKEDMGMQRQRGMMGGGQRGEMKYQLEAALFTRSFRMKKKVRPAELRNAGSWPLGRGQGMCIHGHMHTWGWVPLGVCKPRQWQGSEYLLYLTSDKNSLSEKFQKVVFRTPKLKLFG